MKKQTKKNTGQEKEIAYIAHPIGGDVQGNIKLILAIVRHINLTEPNVVPFVPYLSDVMALNDDDAEERKRGLSNNHHLIRMKVPTVIRLYGNRISRGMVGEIFEAFNADIPIRPMTPETIISWNDKLYLNAEN